MRCDSLRRFAVKCRVVPCGVFGCTGSFVQCHVSFAVSCITGAGNSTYTRFVRTMLSNLSQLRSGQPKHQAAQRGAVRRPVPCIALLCVAVPCYAVLLFENTVQGTMRCTRYRLLRVYLSLYFLDFIVPSPSTSCFCFLH